MSTDQAIGGGAPATHAVAGRGRFVRPHPRAILGWLRREGFTRTPSKPFPSRIGAALFLLSFGFVSFVAGGVVTVFNISQLRQAIVALNESIRPPTLFDTIWWHEARFAARGVVTHDPDRSYRGFTLYSSGHEQGARLIDMAGGVVHHWRLPLTSVWGTHAPHLAEPLDDQFAWWDAVHLFPNGDLLIAYATPQTPYGGGVVRIDKDSNLIWKAPIHGHHAFAVGGDGLIFTLTTMLRDDAIAGIGLTGHGRYLDDRITILGEDGAEIKSFSILESFVGSDYHSLVDLIQWDVKGDLLHANDIEYIDPGLAEQLPFAGPGDLLVSMRHLNAIAVVDPDTEKVVWAMRGPWVGQHDPDVLENGNILIFDNRGHVGPGGQSRVVEFNPATLATVWAYTGTAERPFFSRYQSGQQRLPNGNTMIYEAETGRILELSREGDVVWEFINPHRATHEGKEYVAGLGLHVQRFAPEDLQFLSGGQEDKDA